MDFQRRSTAGRREFESTAIKKLMAEGVPHDVAHAFVTIGIMQRSSRYEQIKDAVCKMEYVEFFLPVSHRDFTDPLRIGGPGTFVPRVEKHHLQKFHTMFAMADVEAVKFTKAFPEFNVVTSGKVFNQHAYYANKRYGETELLVSLIYSHVNRYGVSGSFEQHNNGLPGLIDLGGNYSWHEKRDRSFVHCDNPVLSARDVARYTVRELFSGEDPAAACRHTFQQCKYRAPCAMAVHSTYDLTPKKIAAAMLSKGVEVFFGVINVIPGIHAKPAGVYESDGLVATLVRPSRSPAYIKYTFRHDPSMEYTHLLRDANQYLYVNRRYDFVDRSGASVSFVYKIHSVRGNALVFSIVKGQGDYSCTSSIWTPPRQKSYFIQVKSLDIGPTEVQCEFFDRLVMQAAGARTTSDYDIVSLFRYAKSLRQRVSINNIVLSSGYSLNPQQLVEAVIVAYVVAAAFRIESVNYFKKASSQIMALRGQGFVRDLYSVASAMVSKVVEAAGALVGKLTFYTKLNDKLKTMLKTMSPVDVLVDRPHAGRGMTFMRDMLVLPPQKTRGSQLVRQAGVSSLFTPLSVGGWDASLSRTSVKCAGIDRSFFSYGVPALAVSEKARDCMPEYYGSLDLETDYPVRSEEFRALAYGKVLRSILSLEGYSSSPLVNAVGDRIWRRSPTSILDGPTLGREDMPFVGPQQQYVVFRGVGSKAVSLGKPKMYSKGVCLAFVLFYEEDDETLVVAKRLKTIDGGMDEGMSSTAFSKPSADDVLSEWGSAAAVRKGVTQYDTPEQARQAVVADVEAGFYTMTGALPVRGSVSPPISVVSTATEGEPVTRIVRAAISEPGIQYSSEGPPDDDLIATQEFWEDSGPSVPANTIAKMSADVHGEPSSRSVSSSKIEFAKDSMREFIKACEASERVAIASARECIDLALAVTKGQASLQKWEAVIQGVPGSPAIVKVVGGEWVGVGASEVSSHMAVSDGEAVYDRLVSLPSDGVYVTSDIMKVYTGAAVKAAVQKVMDDDYVCEVVSMNGVAGSGKTYQIIERAMPGDVVLCETSASLKHTATQLAAKPGWRGTQYTVDSYLIHVPSIQCNTLFIDESFRLHAAKIFALMKLLKPTIIYCFGDSKQIPVLPYIPDFDFLFHEFPFDRTVLKKDSWRCPADVCFALSTDQYYGFSMETHRENLRSLRGPLQFDAQQFVSKPTSSVLLVYTQSVKEELVKSGIKNVMTIGESQGSTFDNVLLFRDSPLRKFLYYDLEQTLVAITRHKVSLLYVTVLAGGVDDSAAAMALAYVSAHANEVRFLSHVVGTRDEGVEGGGIVLGDIDDLPDDDSDLEAWADLV